MEALVPYVHFDGNCEEALEFYSKILDGKVIYKSTFGESPMEVSKEFKDKIMHANFQAGSLTLFASDCPPEFTIKRGNNMSLCMNFRSVETIDKIFAQFSEGATVTMQVQDTFWGARFGMLTDKFGINWMFNTELPKK